MQTHLLITARDPGAAQNMVPVIHQARTDARFSLTVAADGAARDIFSKARIDWRAGDVGTIDSDDPNQTKELVEKGHGLVAEVGPDAILAGSSGPDAGLDEAVIAAATRTTGFVLQDYWGDANRLTRGKVDLYFVVDQKAAELTETMYGTPCHVAGPPKYAGYADLEITEMRQKTRQDRGMADTDTLAVFFGQPHLPEAAMARSCILYNKAVLDAAPSATLFYRPHPREDRDRVVEILSQASSEGSAPTLAEDGDTNALLTACDSAASAFSNCGYDLAWLNRYAKTPLAVMMYVMTEPDIRQIWRDYTRLHSEPVSDQGLAACVEDEDDLAAAVATTLQQSFRNKVHDLAAKHLPDAKMSPTTILDKIYEQVTELAEQPTGAAL